MDDDDLKAIERRADAAVSVTPPARFARLTVENAAGLRFMVDGVEVDAAEFIAAAARGGHRLATWA